MSSYLRLRYEFVVAVVVVAADPLAPFSLAPDLPGFEPASSKLSQTYGRSGSCRMQCIGCGKIIIYVAPTFESKF